MRRVLIAAVLLVVLLATGFFAALRLRKPPRGGLDTALTDVSVSVAETAVPEQPSTVPQRPRKERDSYPPETCWPSFGGSPARSLSRPRYRVGKPRKPLWARAMRDLMEYPPSYCDGILYVNLMHGSTLAVNSHTGKFLWRRLGGETASTPAIAGPRLIVSSHAGTVTALARNNGRLLWQLRTGAPVESSPVAVGKTVYVGAADGRLFALDVRNGRVRWAYRTGGRISSSPSVVRGRVCITTYAGAVLCLRRKDGRELWTRYFRRDPLRFESFYASPSTDGQRIFTVARSGKVLALSLRTGRVVWTRHRGTLVYGTPAVASGRIFVGGFDGTLYAYRSTSGRTLWRRHVGGRILAPAMVAGNLVFVSTLEGNTWAARVNDGTIVWRIRAGKYSPGIVTNRRYYFSLNGLLAAFRPERRVPQ